MGVVVILLIFSVLANHSVFAGQEWPLPENIDAVFEWTTIDFVWPSAAEKQHFIDTKQYIAENVIITNIRIFKDILFVALPRIKIGVPMTIAWMSAKSKVKSPLLNAFSTWEEDVVGKCDKFQSVSSFEIDLNDVMWIIDTGKNPSDLTKNCGASIFFVNLNPKHKDTFLKISRRKIPIEIADRNNQLNNIVIDDYDGGYAYITDGNIHDPAIIIYRKRDNTMWKFQHRISMTAARNAVRYKVSDTTFDAAFNIHGIAISPQYFNKYHRRAKNVYFSPGSSRFIYATTTSVLRNETVSGLGRVRGSKLVTRILQKTSQSSNMVFDEYGYLYYGLFGDNEIDRWRDRSLPSVPPLDSGSRNSTYEVFMIDKKIPWVSSFSIQGGHIYYLNNNYHKFTTNSIDPSQINQVIYKSYINWSR